MLTQEGYYKRVFEAEQILDEKLGTGKFLGLIPGTGWKTGLEQIFREQLQIAFPDLKIFGSEVGGVSGDHVKAYKFGEIQGKPVVLIGRTHPNEDPVDLEGLLGIRMSIEVLRNRLSGLIITNGVGALNGDIPLPNPGMALPPELMTIINNIAPGSTPEEARNLILNVVRWAVRGRPITQFKEGDIGLVENYVSLYQGGATPLFGGEFPDVANAGIHGWADKAFQLARKQLEALGFFLPTVNGYVHGPGFESLIDKILMSLGADTIGMSGLQDASVATRLKIAFVWLVFVTNMPFGLQSDDYNTELGKKEGAKTASAIEAIVSEWPDSKDEFGPQIPPKK